MSPDDLALEAFAATRLDVLALARSLSGHEAPGNISALAWGAGLATPAGLPTDTGTGFLDAIRDGELDRASGILAKAHPPYRAYLDDLRANGKLPRAGAASRLRRNGIRVTPAVATSVAQAAVHLAQAYTTLGRVRDGSRRPGPHTLAAMLREAAQATASDGIARVSDLLGPLCAQARMSPYALNAALNSGPDVGRLAGLALSPSAGSPVRSRDAVIVFREDGYVMEPVPSDRFRLGERPVFVAMVERRPDTCGV